MNRVLSLSFVACLALVLQGCPGKPGDAAKADASSTSTTKATPSKPAPPKPRALGGRWKEAGALPLGIERPVAVELSDGRVFAYGNGDDPRGAIWNPKTHAWTATSPSKRPRGESGASLLPDGTILVTGGVHVPKGHYVLRSSERYDPATDSWKDVGSTGAQRRGHTHTTLSDGRVLVVGGVGGGFSAPTRRIDAFDPKKGTFSEYAELGVGRSFHASLDLGSAGLLVVGGQDKEGPLRTVEICNPGAKRCRILTRPTVRDRAAIALLSNGNVLITGGLDSRATGASEVIYDPGKSQFQPTGAMRTRRNGHSLTALADGRLLAVGGEKSASASAEVYDPSAKGWAKAPGPDHGRHGHAALRLKDGSILLVGGVSAKGKPVLMTERL
ncbi:MAG: hypothetical protein QF464_01410 [Myxococcota bacterium]|nr:hypothetical protein [Myxococcota bacterium]